MGSIDTIQVTIRLSPAGVSYPGLRLEWHPTLRARAIEMFQDMVRPYLPKEYTKLTRMFPIASTDNKISHYKLNMYTHTWHQRGAPRPTAKTGIIQVWVLLKYARIQSKAPQTKTKNRTISNKLAHFGMGELHKKAQLRP